jgi:hypothetical protein
MEHLVGLEYHYQHVFTNQFEQNSGKIQIYLQALKKILTLTNKLFYNIEHELIYRNYCTWPQWLCFYVFLFYRVKCTWILTYPIHVSFTKNVSLSFWSNHSPLLLFAWPQWRVSKYMGIWHFKSKNIKNLSWARAKHCAQDLHETIQPRENTQGH